MDCLHRHHAEIRIFFTIDLCKKIPSILEKLDPSQRDMGMKGPLLPEKADLFQQRIKSPEDPYDLLHPLPDAGPENTWISAPRKETRPAKMEGKGSLPDTGTADLFSNPWNHLLFDFPQKLQGQVHPRRFDPADPISLVLEGVLDLPKRLLERFGDFDGNESPERFQTGATPLPRKRRDGSTPPQGVS